MQRQRLRPRRTRMERLPLHIGLFLIYVLFQLVTTSFSSSSTAPPVSSSTSSPSKAPEPSATSRLPSSSTTRERLEEGQRELIPGEVPLGTTTLAPKDDKSKEKDRNATTMKEGLEKVSGTASITRLSKQALTNKCSCPSPFQQDSSFLPQAFPRYT
jgi:hypothetical protein